MVPWEEFRSLLQTCFKYSPPSPKFGDSQFLDHIATIFQRTDLKWRPGWEEIEDSQLFEQVSWKKTYDGEIYVVTEALYVRDYSPLKINGFILNALIREHQDLFGEPFFDSDVTIISFEKKLIWAFHHSGASTYIDLSHLAPR